MKAFAILKAFRGPDEWLTSCELSRRANLPEASGYRLIQTLEEIGAVVRGARGRYRPGLLLLSLSHNVTITDSGRRYGAKGDGPSIYILDPDGNSVELKGPPGA